VPGHGQAEHSGTELSQFLEELKRRNVFRVGFAYVVVAWLILQVVDLVLDAVPAPEWVMQVFLLGTAVGFPVALLFAWAFEMTPEGVKREKDVDRSQSITRQTGRKLDFVIIAVLISAVSILLVDKFLLEDETAGDAVIDKSVAVLPFVAMSSGPDDEYFADGLTEEILNSLAQLPDLLVSARTSAFYFKGKDIPVGEIALKLGVAHIVEGSVRRDGEQLRVTAQLVRASDGFHLWSNTYDRTATSSFAVQSDIAEKVALSLNVVLDEEQRESMREIGLRDPEAFVAFQKGVELYFLAHGDADRLAMLERANTYFDRALQLAPDFAMAYELHADYYAHLLIDSGLGVAAPTTMMVARERLQQDFDNAIRNAPTQPQRLSLAFDLAFLTGDWNRLSSILDELVSDSDCEKPGWLDSYALAFRMTAESISLLQRALECDPMNYSYWNNLTQARVWAGDAEDAITVARNGLNSLTHIRIKEALANALIAAGQFDDAKRFIDREFRDDRRLFQYETRLASARGDAGEANRLLEAYGSRLDDTDLLVPGPSGRRDLANEMAHRIDAQPYGYLRLMTAVMTCYCGAPFDLEVTPDFARRLEEAELPWPPASPIDWPLKDW
jgi:TolB-like protein